MTLSSPARITSRPVPTPPPAGWPTVVAHRGASARAPENTLSALREAVRRGADMVEFDVRRSRDGVLVLCHDATVERTTDARRALPGQAPWAVADLTLHELRRLDAGAWWAPSYAGEPVPTLAEALELLRPTGVTALVELKSPSDHPDTVQDLVAELGRTRLVPDRIIVQSFDAGAVVALRQRLPAVRIGALMRHATRSRIRDVAGWADLVNVHHQWLGRAVLAEARTHGLGCYAWTVNQPGAMRRLIRLGVDGIVTDHPDLLLSWASAARVTCSGPEERTHPLGGLSHAASM